MKRILGMLMVVLLVGMMFASTALAEGESTIVVSGSATVQVAPDVVYIRLGVVQTEKDVVKAQSRTNEKINAVVAALKDNGVEEKDIATDNLSIYAEYEYDSNSGKRTLSGYTASCTLRIKTTEISKAGALIDAAFSAGANNLSDVEFAILEKGETSKKALALAVEAAKEKAEVIAEAGGVKLGIIVGVTENSGAEDYYRSYANVYSAAEDAGASTEVQSGMLDISANVTVTYAIE